MGEIVNKTDSKKLGLASDHAGYELKVKLRNYLKAKGFDVKDFGCHSALSCDYPDFAHPLAKAVQEGVCHMGITLCGSGNGINMVVNKYTGVRSALCWNEEIARLARSHNDANNCALPARFITYEEAIRIVYVFLHTDFDEGRHRIRISKIPNQERC